MPLSWTEERSVYPLSTITIWRLKRRTCFDSPRGLELEFPKWKSAPEEVGELKAQLINPEIGACPELQDFHILDNETES